MSADGQGEESGVTRIKERQPMNAHAGSFVEGDASSSNSLVPNETKQASITRAYTQQLTQMFSRMEEKAHEKIFKSKYTKRECKYVFYAGILGSFNYGFVNGCCLSGLLSETGETASVAGLSGHYTKAGLALAEGDITDFGYFMCLILSYMMGSFLTGFISPDSIPYQIDPKYGPTFLLGAIFLLVASLIAALDYDLQYAFYFACAANGIQNGIASLYSANLIRCSLTGSSIDVALILGKATRGNRHGIWRLAMILVIIVNFFLGGLVSYWAASQFLHMTLLFNAALFLLIGVSLLWFLVKELDVSVSAALFGTWVWKSINIPQLMKQGSTDQICTSTNDSTAINETPFFLVEMFDEIDRDHNGIIDFQELLVALLNVDPDISPGEVTALIEHVDTNGDGMLDREEWTTLVNSTLLSEMARGTKLASAS